MPRNLISCGADCVYSVCRLLVFGCLWCEWSIEYICLYTSRAHENAIYIFYKAKMWKLAPAAASTRLSPHVRCADVQSSVVAAQRLLHMYGVTATI